jgi:hypothetical protein
MSQSTTWIPSALSGQWHHLGRTAHEEEGGHDCFVDRAEGTDLSRLGGSVGESATRIVGGSGGTLVGEADGDQGQQNELIQQHDGKKEQ